MVKRGWEVSGDSLSGLEMRWAAFWTSLKLAQLGGLEGGGSGNGWISRDLVKRSALQPW
jgi:hypothetical protein